PLVMPWRVISNRYFRISARLFSVQLFSLTWRDASSLHRSVTMTTSFDAPYRQQSEILEASDTKWFHSRIPESESINTAIFVGEEWSAAPGEAVIGLMQGRLAFYGQQRYGFRRHREDQTIRVDTPIRADLKVVTWSVERGAARYAPAAWEKGLKGTWSH